MRIALLSLPFWIAVEAIVVHRAYRFLIELTLILRVLRQSSTRYSPKSTADRFEFNKTDTGQTCLLERGPKASKQKRRGEGNTSLQARSRKWQERSFETS